MKLNIITFLILQYAHTFSALLISNKKHLTSRIKLVPDMMDTNMPLALLQSVPPEQGFPIYRVYRYKYN
jgi:hypothetical protein